MRKLRSVLCCVFAVLGLGGAHDDLAQWMQWVKIMDLKYWLTSGEWLPWGIRATFIVLITLMAINPEWTIRMRDRINPRWLDGSGRVGLLYSFSWWWQGVLERIRKEKDV